MKYVLSVILLISSYSSFSLDNNNLFPSVEGWAIGKIDTWGPENLYTPIDGAADMFLSYNFEEMQSAIYTRDSNYIRVEVYRHKTPVDAFGAYSQEKPERDIYLSLGVEGYSENYYINFVVGRYYIKITTSKLSEEINGEMMVIALRQEKVLKENSEYPSLFYSFPEEEKKRYTEKYINENVMGYSFLHSSYEVAYKALEGDYTLFILQGEDEEDAKKMLRSYFDYFKLNPSIGEDRICTVQDKYTGVVYVLQSGKYLICSRGNISAEKSRFLLTFIEKSLPE